MLVHKGTVPCSPRPNARQQAVSRSGSLPSIRPLNKPSFRPLNKHLIACKAQADQSQQDQSAQEVSSAQGAQGEQEQPAPYENWEEQPRGDEQGAYGGEWEPMDGTENASAASSMAEATVGVQQQQGEEAQAVESEEEEPMTLGAIVADFPTYVRETNVGKGVALAGLLLLGGTFFVAFQRYWAAYTSPGATRSRQVNKNKLLVEELSQLLPQARQSLTPGKIRSLRSKTKFTPVEIFRKYLWYMLRERTFDQTTVDDILALRDACGLNDDDVAEALRERAQRIYDKYGTLMLNTEGMTPEGIERKATCQNLFRKLLFLTEYEPLVKQTGGAAVSADLRKIFGATDEDVERLRIVSLFDVDLEKAFGMQASTEDEPLDSPKPPQSPKQEEPGRQQ
eukprot:CAMPEP_0202346298 /NCGR_PEP_ID=MMETSP1126-20121109/5147_1 /ASSEMBLY_ACC=CAM_ASM_000457 /TAXON_ID=3047 /ORGANISM="Dunaliella tertiolecta, Strain CCMP1320" /LENGTH=394 /DNA_ID=CAMNT_0048937683 /DNA_START=1327 /DNA_END=2511 /DNA_ORIENTATION=-